MLALGLISNPRSQQNKRGMPRLQAAADALPGLRHHRLEAIGELPEVLADFARREIGILAVAGGDGTVQAAMTELLERRPFGERPPVLALLPRGMTNMTAADVGLRGGPERNLRRLGALAAEGGLEPHLRRRAILRLEGIAGTPPQRGMFFGAAGIQQAIEICRRRVHSLGAEANWAAGLTLAGLLLGWALGTSRDALAGEPVGTAFDGGPESLRQELLVLVTTLDRLVLGSRPFWNQGGGPLRYSAVAHPPERLLLQVRKVLYGGERRRLPEGYRSRGAETVTLRLQGAFTLDGERYEPDPARPLLISAADSLSFLRF